MKTFLTYLTVFACGVALAGCSTTWGYKSRTGANVYPATDWQTVKLLWSPPAVGTYEEIGVCSVLGGAAFITSDVDMFNKLRKAAADLGADAVIVMREGSTRASWASGSGSWNSYGGFASASGWSSDYPRNFGIAIKWSGSSKS
jgi:hypothetical protein